MLTKIAILAATKIAIKMFILPCLPREGQHNNIPLKKGKPNPNYGAFFTLPRMKNWITKINWGFLTKKKSVLVGLGFPLRPNAAERGGELDGRLEAWWAAPAKRRG